MSRIAMCAAALAWGLASLTLAQSVEVEGEVSVETPAIPTPPPPPPPPSAGVTVEAEVQPPTVVVPTPPPAPTVQGPAVEGQVIVQGEAQVQPQPVPVAPQPVPVAPAPYEPQDGPRFRWGISGLIGTLSPTDYRGIDTYAGAMGGLTAQFGAQINQFFGVTYNIYGAVGYFETRRTTGEVVGEAIAPFYHSAVFDFTPIHWFQIGAGPALHFYAGCAGNLGTVTIPACTDGGPYFGLDIRAAFILGSSHPARRNGFAIAFNFHPTLRDPDSLVGGTISFGFLSY